MGSFLEEQVHLFTGKGGVGKSTLVAGLAIAASERGARPLVVELGHRATMETLFDGPIGYDPTDVGHGVCVLNMELEPAIHDYVAEQVRSRFASRIVRIPALRRFFHAAPAVAEIVTLHRLAALAAERDGTERRWWPILVDLDATGHAQMFLSLPRVLGPLADGPPLAAVMRRIEGLLSDPLTTRLHLVTVPAELPAQETGELHARLTEESSVAFGCLVINRIPVVSLQPGDELQLSRLEAIMPAEVRLARRQLRIAARAEGIAARLTDALPLPVMRLPALSEPDGRVGLRELGRALLEVRW